MVERTTSKRLDRTLIERPIIELEWRKRAGSNEWHFGTDNNHGSFATLCNSSWDIGDDFEMVARPPHADRCDACERTRIDRIVIERGLLELADNCDADDIGGEG